MTSNELRRIVADALEKAAERLRAGIVAEAEPKRVTLSRFTRSDGEAFALGRAIGEYRSQMQ
jgi:hypothetical protein